MKTEIDFSRITACGECCTGCEKLQSGACRGCLDTDGRCEEWKESGQCAIFRCTREHNALFCGLCPEFPCEALPKKLFWRKDAVSQLRLLAQQYRSHDKKD